MSVRLYPKEFVERELHNRKCCKVLDYLTAALWRTQSGYYFTVPQEQPDGRCDENSLREILTEIDSRGR
jgi:hypothetical protein